MQRAMKLLRDIPDFPKPGIIFKDITPILADAAAFHEVTEHFAARYAGMQVDKFLGIDARGFLFASALAFALRKGLIIARKKGKLPYKTISETYSLEYGTDSLEIHIDAVAKGERVVIIDDLLATGGTAKAVANLVDKSGGVVVECAFLVELGFLKGRSRLGKAPVYAPICIE